MSGAGNSISGIPKEPNLLNRVSIEDYLRFKQLKDKVETGGQLDKDELEEFTNLVGDNDSLYQWAKEQSGLVDVLNLGFKPSVEAGN